MINTKKQRSNGRCIWRKKYASSVLGYRIDLYFHDYGIAIEVDKCSHSDKILTMTLKAKKPWKSDLVVCWLQLILMNKILKFKAINKRHRHTKKLSRRFFIDRISKRLLALQIESKIKIKGFKVVCC